MLCKVCNYTSIRHSTLAAHSTASNIQDAQYLQCWVLFTLQPPITLLTLHEHNIHCTPSTIHSIVFHNPPKHTRHSCKMAQDVEMMWKCCGVIPILFGWFLSVPSLHALVFVQKTILWLVAICTHKAWYVTTMNGSYVEGKSEHALH